MFKKRSIFPIHSRLKILPVYDQVNRAGGLAFRDTPRRALYRQVAASLWSGDGYYERKDEWLQRFRTNVSDVMETDPRFPFALAAYARDKNGLALRSSPLALFVEAAAHPAARGSGLIRQYAPRVLRRADEPAAAIEYYRKHYAGGVPHGLLRGIGDTLRGFDEYQLGKYRHSGPVALRDVLRMAHPKPASEEERSLWGRAVDDSLETPYTWEVELSKAASPEAKRLAWNELIASNRLGLFALARNLRNIVEVQADIEAALAQITPERVKGSGILPFQWYKAYQSVEAASGPAIAQPLLQAIEISLAEIQPLAGITLVACDNSGSMSSVMGTRGMSNAEIGNLMGAMALSCCESGLAGTFGERFGLAHTHPRQHLLFNKQAIDACGRTTGHSTNAWTVVEALIKESYIIDRLVLISDMQCYDSAARFGQRFAGHSLAGELDAYLRINPAVKVYSINLATNDNSCQFAPDQPVVQLAGFSESIFAFISSMETGEDIVDWILANY